MWSRNPRPVVMRRGRCRRAVRSAPRCSSRASPAAPRRRARRARRPRPPGRLAAGELGERAQQPRVGIPVRDGHAEAVGEQRLVRERAHHQRRAASCVEHVGTGARASDEVAGLGEYVDVRPCACPPRARRAPRRWRRSARASRRSRDTRARPRRPTTTRSSRAGAARRAPRPARAARGRSRRARRRARSPSRTSAATTRFALLGDQRREVARRRSSRYAWSSTTMPGQAAQIASMSALSSSSPVGLFGLHSQTSRAAGGLAHERLAREREVVARLECEHLGAGVAAGDGVQLIRRLGDERRVAAPERELGAQRQHLVAAGPDDDLARVEVDVARDRALERQVRGVGVVVGRDRGEPRDAPACTRPGPRRACSCRSGRPAGPGSLPASGTDSPARARGGCAWLRSSMLMR